MSHRPGIIKSAGLTNVPLAGIEPAKPSGAYKNRATIAHFRTMEALLVFFAITYLIFEPQRRP